MLRLLCCADWRAQQSAHAARRFLYAHGAFFSDCRGRWLLLARPRVMLCHMLLIFLLIFLLCSEPLGDGDRRSTAAHLQMLPPAALRCHPRVSRG